MLKDCIQAQPWWQYEDDVSKYNVKDIGIGMNKEINQLISKQSFKEAPVQCSVQSSSIMWLEQGGSSQIDLPTMARER
eukprot:4507730-Amphidinium_carterae.1